jgi:hypothetical protein
MLLILGSCLVLGALIAWRVWAHYHRGVNVVINIDDEWRRAYDAAESASKGIFDVENKTWSKEKPVDLSPEDCLKIEQQLHVLEASEQKFQDLMAMLHKKQADDSDEMKNIVPRWLRTKVWILDASDLLEFEKKVPEYGGLYIPMYRTINRSKRGQKELVELAKDKGEILQRNDPAEKEKVRKEIKKIEESFAACQQELSRLEDYLKKGLTREDLSAKDIPDLETMREEASLIGQAMRTARDLRSELRD